MKSAVNLLEKFGLFHETWTPKIIGESNGQLIKLAKLEDEFIWHSHADEDELFFVVKGKLLLKFRDREVKLSEGDLYVVPKGDYHLPIAENECWVLLIEPKGTKHTGEQTIDRTVAEHSQEWI